MPERTEAEYDGCSEGGGRLLRENVVLLAPSLLRFSAARSASLMAVVLLEALLPGGELWLELRGMFGCGTKVDLINCLNVCLMSCLMACRIDRTIV